MHTTTLSAATNELRAWRLLATLRLAASQTRAAADRLARLGK